MAVYFVTFDGDHQYVEAASMAEALVKWKEAESDKDDDDDEPDSITHVSSYEIIR